jgi:N-acetylneuraminic acid mutarotase
VNFNSFPVIFAIGPYIYVGGGGHACGYRRDFYRYDPATDTWLQRANLPADLAGAVGASDGTYGYLACGEMPGGGRSDFLYRYNPSTNSWTFLSLVPGPNPGTREGRFAPSMAYYQGKLYIGGGWGSVRNSGGCLWDFHAYDIATNSWTRLPDHPIPHFDGWAVAYNGKIYVTGEHFTCSNNCINQFHYYDIASNTWSPMPVFPGGNRNNLQLVELNGVLYGGWGHNCAPAFIRDWWAFCP